MKASPTGLGRNAFGRLQDEVSKKVEGAVTVVVTPWVRFVNLIHAREFFAEFLATFMLVVCALKGSYGDWSLASLYHHLVQFSHVVPLHVIQSVASFVVLVSLLLVLLGAITPVGEWDGRGCELKNYM